MLYKCKDLIWLGQGNEISKKSLQFYYVHMPLSLILNDIKHTIKYVFKILIVCVDLQLLSLTEVISFLKGK